MKACDWFFIFLLSSFAMVGFICATIQVVNTLLKSQP